MAPNDRPVPSLSINDLEELVRTTLMLSEWVASLHRSEADLYAEELSHYERSFAADFPGEPPRGEAQRATANYRAHLPGFLARITALPAAEHRKARREFKARPCPEVAARWTAQARRRHAVHHRAGDVYQTVGWALEDYLRALRDLDEPTSLVLGRGKGDIVVSEHAVRVIAARSALVGVIECERENGQKLEESRLKAFKEAGVPLNRARQETVRAFETFLPSRHQTLFVDGQRATPKRLASALIGKLGFGLQDWQKGVAAFVGKHPSLEHVPEPKKSGSIAADLLRFAALSGATENPSVLMLFAARCLWVGREPRFRADLEKALVELERRAYLAQSEATAQAAGFTLDEAIARLREEVERRDAAEAKTVKKKKKKKKG